MRNPIKLSNSFPSDLKLLIILSIIFAALGFIIGLPLVIFNLDLPPLGSVEFDTLEHMNLSIRYFLRFLGAIGTIVGGYGMISCYLTLQRHRIGWIMLLLLYLGAIIGCLYLILRFFDLLTRYPSLSLPIFPITGLFVGFLGIGILIREKNRNFVFNNPLNSF